MVNILFVNSLSNDFGINWNGETVRTTAGKSGTHMNHIFMAEAFAKKGHNTYVTSHNISPTTHNGVKYIKMTDCYEHLNGINMDYFFTNNHITDFLFIRQLNNYKHSKIFAVMSNPFDGNINELSHFDVSQIHLLFTSKNILDIVMENESQLLKYTSHILPYCIDIDEIKDNTQSIGGIAPPPHELTAVTADKRNKNMSFFPTFERGYYLLTLLLEQLPDFVLRVGTYYLTNISIVDETNPQIKAVRNTSRNSVYDVLNTSKYFIYPLIHLETNRIHYDTFAYCVLEALLHGVVVIAPPVKIFKELYGDAICYIDKCEKFIDPYNLSHFGVTDSTFGEECIPLYLEQIRKLETDGEYYRTFVERGRALKNTYSQETVLGKMWDIIANIEKPLKDHLRLHCNFPQMPPDHVSYLWKLKNEGFEPKVIYDIGSCILHWTNVAKQIWPDATYYLFDAFAPAEFLYEGYEHHIGVLSKEDDAVVKFYQNDFHPTGNSYYREIGCSLDFFPENKYLEKRTNKLDTVVKKRGFPPPDFVKIDVQGAEIDVILGGLESLGHAKRMVVELQHSQYNEGALLCGESLKIIESNGWKCVAPLFQNNGPDGDYGFIRV
jgi:FkbM family methyltransferase